MNKDIMKGKDKKMHSFIQQSAGGIGQDSWSHQICTQCGTTFTHRYQKEAYGVALKKAGVTEFCTLKEEINE